MSRVLMGLEDYVIVGTYLRGYLAGLRRMTNAKYPELLKAAGLERYADQYPPDSLEPAGTGREVSDLIRAMRTSFNPNLFNLNMRNLGRQFALTYAGDPVLQEAFAQVNLLPAPRRLPEQVQLILKVNYQFLNEEMELAETGEVNTVMVNYKDCLYCADVVRADKPACPMINAFYRAVLDELTGQPHHVQETSCGAVTGTHHCQFLIQRA